eukprot:TRINITY_DN613_c2_g1_i1.p1 TRINITY_DN613_c2_g1~~TRINITY_DN613_c2_g1_i1.p1  ORF type:complete len:1658 (+),score=656.05 TRINITY_DN613_c2_g1_i1:91-4974(+)
MSLSSPEARPRSSRPGQPPLSRALRRMQAAAGSGARSQSAGPFQNPPVRNVGADPGPPLRVARPPPSPASAAERSAPPRPSQYPTDSDTSLPRRRRQEAKSTVHVCPRFAPVRDAGRGELDYCGDDSGLLLLTMPVRDGVGNTDDEVRQYQFARVFDGSTTEDDIYQHFWSEAEPMLQGGFNVTVLCYGQTGSGKTHTINHLLPRMVHSCFKWMEAERDAGEKRAVSFRTEVSFLQIYLDTVYDLLAGSRDAKRGEVVNWRNCTQEALPRPSADVDIPEAALELVRKGNRWRATNRHALNDRSSRSHTLFFLTMVRSENGLPVQSSTLTMVDLAGSERVAKTKSTGGVFDEGRSINKSLTTLRRVLEGLSRGDVSVPFRDNVLTVYLRESFTNAYFALVCCCSGAQQDTDETRCTLDFGSVAKRVQITRRQAELAKLRQRERERLAQRDEAAAAHEQQRLVLQATQAEHERAREQLARAAAEAAETAEQAEERHRKLQEEALQAATAAEEHREQLQCTLAELAAAREEVSMEEAQLQAAGRRKQQMQQDAESLGQQRQHFETLIAACSLAAEEHLAVVRELEGDAAELAAVEARLAGLERERGERELELEDARGRASEAAEGRAAAERAAADAEQACVDADAELSAAREALATLQRKVDQGPVAGARAVVRQLKEELAEARGKAEAARAAAEARAVEQRQHEHELERLRFALSVSAARVSRLRLVAADAERERGEQQQRLAAAQADLQQAAERAKAECAAEAERRDALQRSLPAAGKQCQRLAEQRRELQAELDAAQGERMQAAEETQQAARTEEQLRQQGSELRGELAELRVRADTSQDQRRRKREETTTVSCLLQSAQSRAAEAAAHAELLRAELAVADRELAESQGYCPAVEQGIEAARSAAAEHAAELRGQHAAVVRRRSAEAERLQERKTRLAEEAAGEERRAAELLKERPTLQRRLEKLNAVVDELSEERRVWQRDLLAAEAERAAAEDDATRLRQRLQELRSAVPDSGRTRRRRMSLETALAAVKQRAAAAAESHRSSVAVLEARLASQQAEGQLRRKALTAERAVGHHLRELSSDAEVEMMNEMEDLEALRMTLDALGSQGAPPVPVHLPQSRDSSGKTRHVAALDEARAALRELALLRAALRRSSRDESTAAGSLQAAAGVAEFDAEHRALEGKLRAEIAEGERAHAVLLELREALQAAAEEDSASAVAERRALRQRLGEAAERLNSSEARCRELAAELPFLLSGHRRSAEEAAERRAQGELLAEEARAAQSELAEARRELMAERQAGEPHRRRLEVLSERNAELSQEEDQQAQENKRLQRSVEMLRQRSAQAKKDVKEETRNRVRMMRLERDVGHVRAGAARLREEGRDTQKRNDAVREELRGKQIRLAETLSLLDQVQHVRDTDHKLLGGQLGQLEVDRRRLKSEAAQLEEQIRALSQYCRVAERQQAAQRGAAHRMEQRRSSSAPHQRVEAPRRSPSPRVPAPGASRRAVSAEAPPRSRSPEFSSQPPTGVRAPTRRYFSPEPGAAPTTASSADEGWQQGGVVCAVEQVRRHPRRRRAHARAPPPQLGDRPQEQPQQQRRQDPPVRAPVPRSALFGATAPAPRTAAELRAQPRRS